MTTVAEHLLTLDVLRAARKEAEADLTVTARMFAHGKADAEDLQLAALWFARTVRELNDALSNR
jgi:hypothetical protein